MEEEKKDYVAHVLAVPWQTPGHINPMLQFCKRLVSKGLKATLVITNFLSKSVHSKPGLVQIDTISDGYDEGGFKVDGLRAGLARFRVVGSQSLAELIKRHESSGHPIDCIISDSLLPWIVDVAKQFDLVAASFFTHQCAVNYINYHVYHGLLSLPVSSLPISIPGLPAVDPLDMPSFTQVPPDYLELVLSQFSTMDKADHILVNTFYELEHEVVDAMSAKVGPLMTIGPTIPSFYLDNGVENDNVYGLNFSHLEPSPCMDWLSTKPTGSVVYVSFGSVALASPGNKQMEELAWGLKGSNSYFLWVVSASDVEKLPENFVEETSEKGLIVRWSPQLEVLSSKAVGCFLSHCGWNSTIEALCLGVPMVAMPQWADQPPNAKFIQDVWRVGIRVKVDENGLVGREEIEGCIREVIEGERGKELKKNAIKWKDLAKEAVSEGGTSDTNINEFISKLTCSSSS